MDCSPSGPSVHGIFQARVLEWGAMGFSRLRPLSYVNYTSLKPKWKHFKLNVSIVHKETSWILTLHLSSFYLKGALIKDLSMKSLADVGTSDNSKKDSSLAIEYLCYLHTLDALKEKGRKRMGRRTSNSIWLVIKMQLLRIRFLFVCFFFLILIALLNCNLHTIKFTYYKVYSVIIFSLFIVVQPSSPSSFRASPSLQKVDPACWLLLLYFI